MEFAAALGSIAPWIAVSIAPIAGSFVGVLVLRLPDGAPIALDRSRCDHCGKTLRPWDLLPLISWIVQRGRCRHCRHPVSAFYPGVEAAALVVAVWAVGIVPGWIGWISCALGWTLLALTLIDLRHYWLPDVLTLPLIAAGLAVAWAMPGTDVLAHLLGAAVGFAAFELIRWLYARWRRREGIGGGDAKLVAAAGAWVSWHGLPSVLILACLGALAVVAARRLFAGAPLRSDQLIAFGPYLCGGIWLTWLYGPLTFGGR